MLLCWSSIISDDKFLRLRESIQRIAMPVKGKGQMRPIRDLAIPEEPSPPVRLAMCQGAGVSKTPPLGPRSPDFTSAPNLAVYIRRFQPNVQVR